MARWAQIVVTIMLCVGSYFVGQAREQTSQADRIAALADRIALMEKRCDAMETRYIGREQFNEFSRAVLSELAGLRSSVEALGARRR